MRGEVGFAILQLSLSSDVCVAPTNLYAPLPSQSCMEGDQIVMGAYEVKA